MTRATLLHVLERPTALGPAEVRELEQLAQAFPYCQTAHLLLAKAAHDQGTMLAGQRLRRAATYAADRTLLRRLIEQEEPAAPALAEPEPAAQPAPPHPLDLVDWPDEYVPPVAAPPAGPARFVAPTPSMLPVAAVEAAAVPAPEAPTEPVVPVLTAAPPTPTHEALLVPEEAPAPLPIESAAVAPAETAAAPVAAPAAPAPLAAEDSLAAVAAPIAAPITLAEALAPNGVATVAATLLAEAIAPLAVAVQLLPTETVPSPTPVEPEPEPELPPQAPAIRPPVEAGEARFEFGLADPAPVVAAAVYELPGLVDEWAASAVTRSLGSPGAPASPPAPAPVAPVFTPAAFTGDAVVGYAFGESSRLGLSMQLLDLLAAKAEAAESATAVVAAAQPPAAPLPPAGTFFEPDPLLLDHWATHCPAPPELPSSGDLINNFLKRQPRLTRPAMLPPAPGGQADLSVRSTRAEPDLVSENLARIFVRQGKTARAIEIYEKLMVKQPEKMAYFALQIQSLQPSA